MTPECLQVVELLGRGVLPRELADHSRTCDGCTATLAGFSALKPGRVPPPSRTALSAARADVLRELEKTPVSPPWWREAAWTALLGPAFAVGGVVVLGRGWQVLNRAGLEPLLLVGALLVLAMIWGAFAASIPRGRLHRLAMGLFALELAVAVPLAGSGFPGPLSFFDAGWRCVASELLVSLVPVGVTLWQLTRNAYSASRALTAGLCAGAAGMFALHLHCPVGSPLHLLCFHVVPWLGLAAITALVRSRLPSRTFAP
jgi:hypothetical protein